MPPHYGAMETEAEALVLDGFLVILVADAALRLLVAFLIQFLQMLKYR